MGAHRCGHCGRILIDRARRECDSLCAAERAGQPFGCGPRPRRGRPVVVLARGLPPGVAALPAALALLALLVAVYAWLRPAG